MPTLTPNFALPYPNGSDAPCDFAQQWCAFSDAFQVALDDFQATIDRTNPVIPIAQLLRTTPVSVTNLESFTFDTLSLDTGNWVDFDADPTRIRINQGGTFTIVANAETQSVAGSNQYTMFVSSTPGAVSQEQDVFTVGVALGFMATATVIITAPAEFKLSFSTDGLSTLVLNRAMLCVFWHADRTTP